MQITKKEEDENEDLSEKNPTKFSNNNKEDFAKKTEADFAKSQKNEKEEIEKANLDTCEKSKEDQRGIEDDDNEPKRIQTWRNKFTHLFPNFLRNAAEFYYYFTEIVVPQKGETRGDGWRKMKRFLFPPRDFAEIAKIKNEAVMKRKAFFERLWISLEEIVDVLAAVFLTYFALGMLALYVEIPRISELAENTLHEDSTILFFTGVFIFFRLLLLIREKFTSWSFLRTLLLFLIGGVVIGFVRINLF